RRRRHERLSAGAVGVAVTVALIAWALATIPGGASRSVPRDGAVLPPAVAAPLTAADGQFYVQQIRETTTCSTASCPGPDLGVDLAATLWWGLDGSGRIDASRHANFGIREGTFGPGAFPTEGDLTSFPTDPAALRTYLVDRSAPNGASPGPGEPTPTPGVDARTGDVWGSIEHLLADPAAYGNTTPALRAALVDVAAGLPMATVDATALDPAGRQAIRIRVDAFQGVTDVFVDPASHDLLALVTTFDDGWVDTYTVLRAGVADSTTAMPGPRQSSIPAAPGS
ncbi:MAG: hypothetical protein ACXVQJ_12125, partial [Actinomycetota bacterium]